MSFNNTKVHKVKFVNNKISCLQFRNNSKTNTGGAQHHNKNNVLIKLNYYRAGTNVDFVMVQK